MLNLIRCEFWKLKRKMFVQLVLAASFLFPIPVWLEELVQCLSADERIILHKLYFEDKSERIASMELGISKTALHQRKVKLLQKLKIFLENMGKA